MMSESWSEASRRPLYSSGVLAIRGLRSLLLPEQQYTVWSCRVQWIGPDCVECVSCVEFLKNTHESKHTAYVHTVR